MLFNRSLATSIFPDIWSFLFVISIFKSGRRNDILNYRGIAKLAAIAKMFELVMYRIMYEDLRGWLADRQHGVIKSSSTLSNLFEYYTLSF
jgi:hypothetical protein